MSGTAVHIVRLYVSVPPSQPPSRKSLAKNSSRMAARLAAKGSTAAEETGVESMALRDQHKFWRQLHALEYGRLQRKSRDPGPARTSFSRKLLAGRSIISCVLKLRRNPQFLWGWGMSTVKEGTGTLEGL